MMNVFFYLANNRINLYLELLDGRKPRNRFVLCLFCVNNRETGKGKENAFVTIL